MRVSDGGGPGAGRPSAVPSHTRGRHITGEKTAVPLRITHPIRVITSTHECASCPCIQTRRKSLHHTCGSARPCRQRCGSLPTTGRTLHTLCFACEWLRWCILILENRLLQNVLFATFNQSSRRQQLTAPLEKRQQLHVSPAAPFPCFQVQGKLVSGSALTPAGGEEGSGGDKCTIPSIHGTVAVVGERSCYSFLTKLDLHLGTHLLKQIRSVDSSPCRPLQAAGHITPRTHDLLPLSATFTPL